MRRIHFKLGEPLTIEEAKKLQPGMVIYHKAIKDYAGLPGVWRVNGQPKTWKRDAKRVMVPLKRGLYQFDYLTEHNIHQFTVDIQREEE